MLALFSCRVSRRIAVFARALHLRISLAVLALLGQLTPAVALPVVALARLIPSSTGGCAGTSCHCSPVEKLTSTCCCSKPKPPPPEPAPAPLPAPAEKDCCKRPAKAPKPKSCCAHEQSLEEPEGKCCEGARPVPEPENCCDHATLPAELGTATSHFASNRCSTDTGEALVTGGPCKCDRPAPVVTSEPAAPPPYQVVLAFDTYSEPGACRWAALIAVDPLPPPHPPPRV